MKWINEYIHTETQSIKSLNAFEWMTSIFWNKYKALIAGAVVKKWNKNVWFTALKQLDTGNMVTSGGESPP